MYSFTLANLRRLTKGHGVDVAFDSVGREHSLIR
jgi:NADPH:quinone reductase-like Zn-dependent oxidoreductase